MNSDKLRVARKVVNEWREIVREISAAQVVADSRLKDMAGRQDVLILIDTCSAIAARLAAAKHELAIAEGALLDIGARWQNAA